MDEVPLSDPTCVDKHKSVCVGQVEPRLHHWVTERIQTSNRCQRHWQERVEDQERIDEQYGPYSDVHPAGVSYEEWSDDY